MVKIADEYGKCEICYKGSLVKVGETIIGGTKYLILKCDKCSHQIARNVKQ